MAPLVSIVIPFYNDPYVEQAVISALGQTYSPLEIIVVDDGSTAETHRLAPYRHLVHYLGKANGGTASALNHGIRHARGEYIAWLSSDDVFYPEKIKRQVAFMIERKALISHTNFHYINSQSQITRYNAAPSQLFKNAADFCRCFLNLNPVNGCTVMIHKKLFDHIGLFNESLPYTQDVDFWYRAILSGVHFPFLDEPLTGYRWHDGMGTLRHQWEIQHEYQATQARYRGSLTNLLSRMN